MGQALVEKVLVRIDKMAELYHRLLLVVAPSGSGKTAALQQVAERIGAPLLNLNLGLSERLLDLTERQRALQLPRMVEEVLGGDRPVVLLDNIEILFDVTLRQDPLRLLQLASRHRTLVAAWSGTFDGRYLVYGVPEHPEYRRYPAQELVVVCPDAA